MIIYQYALNCFSPHYLAFLDAIIPGWEAPDSLYEQVPRLLSIEEHPAYQIQLTKWISEDGSPGVVIRDGFFNIDLICANLIRLNPETGNPVRMGIFLTQPGSFQEDGWKGDLVLLAPSAEEEEYVPGDGAPVPEDEVPALR